MGDLVKSVFSERSTIYHGGDILLMEGDVPAYAECVVVSCAEDGGNICYVGDTSGLDDNMRSKGKWFDLKGACMMPGFIDPHIHPSMAGMLLTMDFITPFDWNLPDRPPVKGIRTEKEYYEGNQKPIKFLKQQNNISYL